MEGLTIAVWRWGSKYPGHYVERLRAGVERHLKRDYRFAVFAPEEGDEYLTKIPGCFCRLRMFDTAWQEKHGITGRIVSIDLDTIITGSLDDLFEIDDPFSILLSANASNPCPYNGSVFSFLAGYRPDVWEDFSLKAASQIKYFEYPDDQAWMHHKIRDAKNWEAGKRSGIYVFQKRNWPVGEALPDDAKIVAFPGWRDPSKFTHLDWVKKHWSA